MSGEITLREITDDDARCLVRWRNENADAFPPGPELTVSAHLDWYYGTYLTDPARVLCTVRQGGEPVGTIGLTVRHGRGEIGNVILGDKSLARQGVMQAAVKQLMAAYGLSHYWLRVMPDNEAAIAFHKRNGFTVLSRHGGECENPLGGKGEYLIMTRSYDGYWPDVPPPRA